MARPGDVKETSLENGNALSKTDSIDHEEQLRNVLTNTMSISPELFERVYLSPKNKVSGDLRKTFANPTPLAILGFSVGLLPLSIELSVLAPLRTFIFTVHLADERQWAGVDPALSQHRQRPAASGSVALCYG